MELMEVYHETMATWIIARLTSGKCEGAEFVFGLIELAIRKEATEILLTPVQELDMVRMDFGRLHCYYRQPEITRPSLRTWQFILSSLVMSPRKKHARKDYSADQTKGFIMCNLKKRVYQTASRLWSSTSKRHAQPTGR